MENIYYIRYFKSKSNVLFFLQFTGAFIVLTVLSVLFYVDLYNEQINPYSKTVMFSQYNLSFYLKIVQINQTTFLFFTTERFAWSNDIFIKRQLLE